MGSAWAGYARERFSPANYGGPSRKCPPLEEKARLLLTTDRYLLEFDVLRRKADARVVMGGAFPDSCVSILSMQDAAPSRYGKLLLLASVKESLDFPFDEVQIPWGGGRRRKSSR